MQAFKWRAKYYIIVSGKIKVLVYKQDSLRNGSLSPLYLYQKSRIIDIYKITSFESIHMVKTTVRVLHYMIG